MATLNAAKLAGVGDKIGVLAAGYAADITVFARRGESALMALLDAVPGSVRLVVVGGKPMLGDSNLMQKLLPAKKLETATVCGFRNSLNIEGDTDRKLGP